MLFYEDIDKYEIPQLRKGKRAPCFLSKKEQRKNNTIKYLDNYILSVEKEIIKLKRIKELLYAYDYCDYGLSFIRNQKKLSKLKKTCYYHEYYLNILESCYIYLHYDGKLYDLYIMKLDMIGKGDDFKNYMNKLFELNYIVPRYAYKLCHLYMDNDFICKYIYIKNILIIITSLYRKKKVDLPCELYELILNNYIKL